MLKEVDWKRRKFLSLSMLSGISLALSYKAFSDELTDLATLSELNQIIAVRLWPSTIYTRLTLEAKSNIQAKYFALSNPTRFVIDVFNAQLNAILRNLSSKIINQDPIIQDIKVGQFNPTTVRVVIYLKQPILAQTRVLPPVSLGSVNYQYRYIFDMYPALANRPKAALNDNLLAFLQLNNDFENANDNTSSPAANVGTKPQSTAFLPLRTAKSKDRLLIMIDPGHGGEDPGAIGPSGIQEKHVVLDIGKRLYDLINQTDYMQARLTRAQDIFIPLGTRVAIAHQAKADLFISVHADAFTTPQAMGSSVFILSNQGASSAFAKWLAKTQNAADLIGGMSFLAKDQTVNKVLLDMTQTWTMNKSDKLGEILLGRLAKVNKLHNHQVEKAAFAVLKAPDIPSALVETAFISNPYEESLLKTSEFRQKIADALFNGMDSFVKGRVNS